MIRFILDCRAISRLSCCGRCAELGGPNDRRVTGEENGARGWHLERTSATPAKEACATGRASFRERRAMTEQEIEHVAKAIYLVRVAPRRFPRKWDELPVEARRSFEKDAIAAITALDELGV